jgi:hypothetical protein
MSWKIVWRNVQVLGRKFDLVSASNKIFNMIIVSRKVKNIVHEQKHRSSTWHLYINLLYLQATTLFAKCVDYYKNWQIILYHRTYQITLDTATTIIRSTKGKKEITMFKKDFYITKRVGQTLTPSARNSSMNKYSKLQCSGSGGSASFCASRIRIR